MAEAATCTDVLLAAVIVIGALFADNGQVRQMSTTIVFRLFNFSDVLSELWNEVKH